MPQGAASAQPPARYHVVVVVETVVHVAEIVIVVIKVSLVIAILCGQGQVPECLLAATSSAPGMSEILLPIGRTRSRKAGIFATVGR